MRVRVAHLAVALVCLAGPAAADATPREDLRRDWHRCVRQSFSGQPNHLGRQAAEKAALAACKASEDAYVAAELDAQMTQGAAGRNDERGLMAHARAMLASVSAYVVEPAATWLGVSGR